ncbi:MAG TPA: glycosyltransferase [Streptosporangiaceae bacterium]
MKIALVAEQASQLTPSRGRTAPCGGPAHGLVPLAGALAGLGHDVTVYARRDAGSQPARTSLVPGVTLERLPAGPAAVLPPDQVLAHMSAFSGQLAKQWNRSTPDVVHAHYWTSGLAALAATRDVSVPVVQTFHTLGVSERHVASRLPWRPRTAAAAGEGGAGLDRRIKMEALIARNVRAVLVRSSGEQDDLTRLGVPRRSVTVVPYGVDTSQFLPDGPVARRSSKPRLLAVDPLVSPDAVAGIIRALAEVPGCELVIAGGPARSGLAGHPVYKQLMGLAASLQVDRRVVFVGQVSQARMPALLRSADLLVHTALYEPFGMAPLEAMACGTPVMAAAGGAHEDEVVDGATGVLVRPGRPAALAARIRHLLSTPMLLQGFGIAAADRARSRYSWDRIGRETVAVYERSLPGGRLAAGLPGDGLGPDGFPAAA